jgi:peptidoglycan/xylan/chitin deacetylase (PgdA/CDA1 family)
LISFTFDDFPRSALFTGGAILARNGLVGTYYVSLGLLGTRSPAGSLFVEEDLHSLVRAGHELGCHTYEHLDSGETSTRTFAKSIERNQRAVARILPGTAFTTFAYPISAPRISSKALIGRHFCCARGGGQSTNVGTADLNYLSAFFLEKAAEDLDPVKELIKYNASRRGWLIFATHDVSLMSTSLGCSPEVLEAVVRHSIESGALILPVKQALCRLQCP